ncbi:MAG: hypothetical protein ABIK97_07205, partial [candidate division WOR-3 bacterium]
RIRFRFVSDYSVTDEGWFVDDVTCGLTGLEEVKRGEKFYSENRRVVNLEKAVEIFTVDGRRINFPKRVSPGIYFLRFPKDKKMRKVVVY